MRREIGRISPSLFVNFTGMHFHVAWAPPPGLGVRSEPWSSSCLVCRHLAARPGEVAPPACARCASPGLDKTVSSGNSHQFTCALGVINYCLTIHVCDHHLGMAYLQALDTAEPAPPSAPQLERPDHQRFAMAASLLRILMDAAQNACLAAVREAELATERRTLAALEQEQAHLHELIAHPLPALSPPLWQHRAGTPEGPLAARLLTYLMDNFNRPITLDLCAHDWGMNAAYLSTCFSRAYGVTFKHCLTELRMEKARILLADPAQRVAAVADAVGYSSENRFRLAFKLAHGLPPSIWRSDIAAGTAPDGV